MKKRILTLLLFMTASISSILSQTTEYEKRVDTRTKKQAEANEELLLDASNKNTPLPYEANMARINYLPALTDSKRKQLNSLSQRFLWLGNAENVTHIGLGRYMAITGAIRWVAFERLSMDVGGLFSRQFYFSAPISRQDITGMNAKLQYSLTNNVQLEMYGQYIFSEATFPYSGYCSFFPHTGIGASVSLDLKANTEVKIGAEYQYDKKAQKWELQSSGTVSIGF